MTKKTADDSADSLVDLIKEYPGIAIAGGVLLGIAVSALMPRGSARKLARGAAAAAAVSSEAGMALARQARETASTAADEASETLERASKGAAQLRKRAVSASGSAASAGLDLTRAAVRFARSLRD